MVDILGQIGSVESGNNYNARNPLSSAGGKYQFTNATFLDAIRKHRPDLAQGQSDEQLLQLKFDPNIQEEIAGAHLGDVQNYLKGRGIEPTPGNSYLGWFAGPAGAAAIHANPGETVRALLGDQAVAANPFLQGMTGQDVIDWAGRKMTPGQHMAKNIRKRFGTPETPAAAGPQSDGMGRLKAALSGKTYDPDNLSGADRLIDQGQAIASTSGNPWGAIGGTILAGLGGYERGQERGNEKAYRNELGRTLGGAEDPIAVARTLMASPDPKLQAAGIEMFSKVQPKSDKPQYEFTKYGVGNKATGELRPYPQGAGPTPDLTPGQKAVDQAFAKDYAKTIAGGGFADPKKNLAQLKGVLTELKNPKGPNLTGSILGSTPDLVTKFTHPEAINAREKVEEVVQRNLREILGAAFTEKEGERLISRAYNPRLPESINAERLDRLYKAMESAYEAKKAAAKYFEQHGTLSGYPGLARVTIEDLESAIDGDGKDGEQRPESGPPAPAVQFLRNNPTPELIDQFNQKYGPGAAERVLGSQPSAIMNQASP